MQTRSSTVLPLAVLACCLTVSLARAQTLFADIHPGAASGAPGSSPGRNAIRTIGSQVYFDAQDELGRELWRTDGTLAGTTLVLDIEVGRSGRSSDPTSFFDLNGLLLFVPTSETAFGAELWRSDGTAAGTRLLLDVRPGIVGSNPRPLAAVGVDLFFSANDGVQNQMWKTDGTSAGTLLVRGFGTQVVASAADQVAVLGARLFFVVDHELWATDGSTAGTVQVKSFTPSSTRPGALIAHRGRVFLMANDFSAGHELWVSDGSTAGTVLLKDIAAGSASSVPANPIVVADVLYFTAAGSGGRELWRSDGTPAGTIGVKDIHPNGSSSPSVLVDAGGVLCFFADDGVSGFEPWRSDGTEAGTQRILDLNPGIAASMLSGTAESYPHVVSGGRWFFGANDGSHGAELWVSDGTATGTTLPRDIQPGTGSALRGGKPASIAGGVVFGAAETGTDVELWRSDGSAAGTVRVADLNRALPGSSDPSGFYRDGTLLFFNANDGQSSTELWVQDAMGTGVRMVKDIGNGQNFSIATSFARAGSTLLFAAHISSGLSSYYQIWRTDGSEAGTMAVSNTLPSIEPLLSLGQGVLVGFGGSGSGGLGITDGTPAGTATLRSFKASPSLLTAMQGIAYFVGDDGVSGLELWRTDGTAGGTTLLHDINPGAANAFYSPIPSELLAIGDRLYFTAQHPTVGQELLRTDGTSTGLALVKDIWPGSSSSRPQGMTAMNGRVFLQADDGFRGPELWVSDGTAAGTMLLADIRPGPAGSSPRSLVVAGNRLFFLANDGVSGYELWTSDGTDAGTRLVADLAPGSLSAPVFDTLAPAGDGTVIVFAASNRTTGVELWRSDGTAAGTRLLTDIAPGTTSSFPSRVTRNGPQLLFAANLEATGRELHSIPLALAGGSFSEPYGRGCPGTDRLVPRIGSVGAPVLGGSAFRVTVAEARANAPAVLFLAGSALAAPLPGGCTLLTGSPFSSLSLATNARGTAAVPLAVPSATRYSGLELFLQYWIIDPQGALFGLVSMSDGLRLLVGQ